MLVHGFLKVECIAFVTSCATRYQPCACCRKSIFANPHPSHVTATLARPLTQAETPPLATKQRAALHADAQTAADEVLSRQFHAQPLNPAILHGPVRLPWHTSELAAYPT